MTYPTPKESVKYDPYVDEHDHLNDVLEKIRQQLAQNNIARHSVIASLADLHKEALAHFVHEEQFDGFFENIVDQAPHLSESSEKLISEHMQLMDELQSLQQASENLPARYWRRDVAQRYDSFVRHFCRHEQAETELMQEAFYRDIGTQD